MERKTIGAWTQAELQSFLLNVAQPAPVPAGFSAANIRTELMRVRGSLDLADEAVLMKGGALFPARSFLGAGNTSNVESMYAETAGTAQWIAAGARLVAQTADLPDQVDQVNTTNQRMHSSLIYVPTRTPVDNIHVYVTEIPSVYNGNNTEIGLYSIGGTDSNPEMTLIEKKTSIGATLTGSTGMKTFALTKTQLLDAGIYVCSILSDRTSITGNMGLAARNASQQDQNGPYFGAYPRTLRKDSVTTGMPTTWTIDGYTSGRVWFGLTYN